MPKANEEVEESRGVYLSPKQVIGIYQSQKGKCLYCPTDLTSRNLTIEHVVSKAWGGPVLELWNLALACWSCNRRKGELEGGGDIADLGRSKDEHVTASYMSMVKLGETDTIVACMVSEIKKRLEQLENYEHIHLPSSAGTKAWYKIPGARTTPVEG